MDEKTIIDEFRDLVMDLFREAALLDNIVEGFECHVDDYSYRLYIATQKRYREECLRAKGLTMSEKETKLWNKLIDSLIVT